MRPSGAELINARAEGSAGDCLDPDVVRVSTMRLILAAAMVTVGLAQPVGTPEYSAKLMRFNQAYVPFFRAYYGCPKGAIDFTECHPEAGITDYAAYLKASKLVAAAFPEAFRK